MNVLVISWKNLVNKQNEVITVSMPYIENQTVRNTIEN